MLDDDDTSHGLLLSGRSFTTIDVPGASYKSLSGINDALQMITE